MLEILLMPIVLVLGFLFYLCLFLAPIFFVLIVFMGFIGTIFGALRGIIR